MVDKWLRITTMYLNELGITKYQVSGNSIKFSLFKNEMSNEYNEDTNKVEFVNKRFKEDFKIEISIRISNDEKQYMSFSIMGYNRGHSCPYYLYETDDEIKQGLFSSIKAMLRDNELPKKEKKETVYEQLTIFDFMEEYDDTKATKSL